jgi:MOSC domain-containing protein YiiM
MSAGAIAMKHLTAGELEAGLDEIRRAPSDCGVIELIVRRPVTEVREVLHEARLDIVEGLVGDSWKDRRSTRTGDGSPHRDMQLTLMSARTISLIAGEPDRWPLAGDQLYLDMDMSSVNLPAWTRLELGTAMIEVTDQPHTGCAKFVQRFGPEAMRFVNSTVGRTLNLRGVYARVLWAGDIRVGDVVRKVNLP